MDKCPLCYNLDESKANIIVNGWDYLVDCESCGIFFVSLDTLEDYLSEVHPHPKVSWLIRHTIAHWIWQQTQAGRKAYLDNETVENAINKSIKLPSPIQQSLKFIRYLGDYVVNTGSTLPSLPNNIYTICGSPSHQVLGDILFNLVESGIVTAEIQRMFNRSAFVSNANLTLLGWEKYEELKRGISAGNFGFLAMKFGDIALDPFAQNIIKPACESLSYTLVDMRDVKEAGVIDNLMRMRIRDSAFLLAELTHANNGAYWEAGFAEGLGKPVIYLCRKSEWESQKTHFDTNHCTTLVWEPQETEMFKKELVATLRNTLKLYAN